MNGDYGQSDGATEQIARIREDVERAVNELDIRRLENHFADDVAMIPVDESRIAGAEAVVEYHRDLYETVIEMDIEFSIENITIVGGLAVEEGTYRQKIIQSGDDDPKHSTGVYLYTYDRVEDGSWKIHRLSWD